MARLAERLRRWLTLAGRAWRGQEPMPALFFLMMLGIEYGRIGRDSYLLSTVGASAIPRLYTLIAILLIAITGVYALVVDRVRAERLMVAVEALGSIVIVSVWAVVEFQTVESSWFRYVIFCVFEVFILFQIMHFWTFANSVFDPWEGKRVYPMIGGAGLLGTIMGGMTTNLIASTFGANTLFLIWSMLLLGMMPLVLHIGRQSRGTATACASGGRADLGSDSVPPIDGEPGPRSWNQTLRVIWRHPLIRTLSYILVPLWMLVYIIEYNYFTTMSFLFPEQDELAARLGLFVGIFSATGLVVQLLVTPRLLHRFGVGATTMVYPFSLTAGALALLAYSLFPAALSGPSELVSVALLVIFARFCDVGIYFSVFDSTSQLLFYSVPRSWRGKARAFISGIVMPISMATAGGLLLFFRRTEEPVHYVSFVGVSLGFLLIIFGLNLTTDYLTALLRNLDPRDASGRADVMEEISRLQGSDIRYALLESVTANNDDEAIFAVDQLFERRDEELLLDVFEVLDRVRRPVLERIRQCLCDYDRRNHPDFVRQLDQLLELSPISARGDEEILENRLARS